MPRVSSDEAAAALASVPDRAVTTNEPGLLPASFVPAVVHALVASVAGLAPPPNLSAPLPDAVSVQRAPSHQQAEPGHVQRAAFASNVVGRLCRRGHAALVAAALWDDLGAGPSCQDQQTDACASSSASGGSEAVHGQQRSGAARAVVAGVQDRVALDRVLEALLRHLDFARCVGDLTV